MNEGADWGSVPAWVQLVGVLVAVVAYSVGRRDAQRAHAAKVYALVVSYRHGDLERAGKPLHTTVVIDNGSELPIFDVGLSLRGWGRRRRLWRIRKRRDWWDADQVAGRAFPVISADGCSDQHELPGLGAPTRPGDSLTPPVLLRFRDGNGRPWIRWPDGRLSSARLSRRAW